MAGEKNNPEAQEQDSFENPDWDRVHRSNFASKGMNHLNWIETGDHLLETAELLEGRIEKWWTGMREATEAKKATGRWDGSLPAFHHLQEMFFLLMGYSIENYGKAFWVRAEGSQWRWEVQEEGELPRPLKTHNLVHLTKETGLPLDVETEDLLRRLTRASTWAGRYPVPLKAADLGPARFESDGKKYSLSWFGGNDVERVKELAERIRHHVVGDYRKPNRPSDEP